MTLKKFILWGGVGAVLYGLLHYHFVFIDNTVSFLKKSSPTLNNTFYSTYGKSNRTILAHKELREAGIGDLLVRLGKMTQEEKDAIIESFSENGQR